MNDVDAMPHRLDVSFHCRPEQVGGRVAMDTVSPYEHDPSASFAELIIPTPDSVRYTYLWRRSYYTTSTCS